MIKLLNFDKILEDASQHFKRMSTEKQNKIKDSLEHGRALLDTNDELKAYIHLYGDIHR